jgi:hypothetical protein
MSKLEKLSVDQLLARAYDEHLAVRTKLGESLRHAKNCGEYLVTAQEKFKAEKPDGEWLKFSSENVHCKQIGAPSTRSWYMNVHRNWQVLLDETGGDIAGLSQTVARALLTFNPRPKNPIVDISDVAPSVQSVLTKSQQEPEAVPLENPPLDLNMPVEIQLLQQSSEKEEPESEPVNPVMIDIISIIVDPGLTLNERLAKLLGMPGGKPAALALLKQARVEIDAAISALS